MQTVYIYVQSLGGLPYERAWPLLLKKCLIEKIINKVLPETNPNYLQYKIHKRWLLSWIHFIVLIRVTTFECFKMQMVINLAPVLLSNRKVKTSTLAQNLLF